MLQQPVTGNIDEVTHKASDLTQVMKAGGVSEGNMRMWILSMKIRHEGQAKTRKLMVSKPVVHSYFTSFLVRIKT